MRPDLRPAVVRVFGDASSIGGGAYMQLGDSQERIPVTMQNWSPEVQGASSAARKIRQMCVAIRAFLQHQQQLLRGRRVRYTGDSTACIAAAFRMKGPAETFTLIRSMYSAARQQDVELSFTWQRRSIDEMRLADLLGRLPDAGDMFVGAAAYGSVTQQAGRPSLDVLAGASTGEHVVDVFYTQNPAAGAAGTNAFDQRWDGTSGEALAWVFPPAGLEAAAANALVQRRCDAILVVPNDQQCWH